MDRDGPEPSSLRFEPRTGVFHADPYPAYRRLREQAPVCYRPAHDDWLISRYMDVKRIIQDPRFQFSDPRPVAGRRSPDWTTIQSMSSSPQKFALLRAKCLELQGRFANMRHPPEHTHLRQIMQPWFTTKTMAPLRQHLQTLLDNLLDKDTAGGEMDLVNDLAFPFTFGMIGTIMGCPPHHAADIRRWTRDVINGFDLNASSDAYERNLWAVNLFAQSMHRWLTAKSQEPADDRLSDFVQAHQQGHVHADDLLANSIALTIAGFESSQNSLGLAVRTLLRQPERWHQLCNEPGLIPTAVEELLRYDGPIQARTQLAMEDVPVAGGVIRRGQRVRLLIVAANRDPEQFPDADGLDLARQPNAHLGFFHGPHYCLGAPLARLEIEVVLSTLAQRLPGLRLADAPEAWLETYFMRGLKCLRVTWES